MIRLLQALLVTITVTACATTGTKTPPDMAEGVLFSASDVPEDTYVCIREVKPNRDTDTLTILWQFPPCDERDQQVWRTTAYIPYLCNWHLDDRFYAPRRIPVLLSTCARPGGRRANGNGNE